MQAGNYPLAGSKFTTGTECEIAVSNLLRRDIMSASILYVTHYPCHRYARTHFSAIGVNSFGIF